jgi:flagellar hook-associated protein 3 FlgL
MQISTKNFFESSVKNMQKAQTEAAKSNEQLSTGKSLIRPSDDTVKLRTIGNLERAIDKVDAQNYNLDHLLIRYSTEESALRSASDVLIRMRELAIQASNGSVSSEDREIISIEIDGLKEQLFSLANTRDADGNTVFAGSRTGQLAFVKADDGSIYYQGDAEKMMVEIGNNRELPKNRNGLEVFAGVRRIDETGEEKTIEFFEALEDLKQVLIAEQKTQIIVKPDELSADSGELTINGVQISKVNENPTLDQLVAAVNAESKRTNVYAYKDENGSFVLENIEGLESEFIVLGDMPGILSGVSGRIGPSIDSRLIERSISEVGVLHSNVAVSMGRIGSETQSAEAQKALNMDVDIRLKQLRSNEVDVDFAEAVARFNVELARLEASQAAFAKLSRLSLFEYL